MAFQATAATCASFHVGWWNGYGGLLDLKVARHGWQSNRAQDFGLGGRQSDKGLVAALARGSLC